MVLKDNTYKTLKFWALVVLPALGTAYFSASGVFGLPYSNEVVSALTIVDTFLGAILHVSTKSYSMAKPPVDGKFIVERDDEKKAMYTLEVHAPLEGIENRDLLTFKVEPGSALKMMTTRP